MKTPFPLYAKILIWFFLNLLVVCAVVFGLLRARFGDSTDWLLASDAKSRIQAMTETLTAELDHTPTSFQDEVLARYSNSYHLSLAVYTNHGDHMAGPDLGLPGEVTSALSKEPEANEEDEGPRRDPGDGPPAGPPRARPPPPQRPEDEFFSDPLSRALAPREGPPDLPPAWRRRGPNSAPVLFPLDLVRTEAPAAYWLLVRAPVIAHGRGGEARLTLVGRIDSLSNNELLFDPRPWMYWGVALLLFSAVFWLPLVRNLTRAISQLTRATERIAEGCFDVRTNEKRRDELGRLGHAINLMSERLGGFVRGQKRFLGDIAHELCSPLARMEMGLGVMEQRVPPEMHERLADVQDEVREMRELVNELLSFSKAGLRNPDAPLQTLEVDDIIREVIEREGEGCTISDAPPNLRMLGDARLILRALGNLVRNAVRYAGTAGPVCISAGRVGEDIHVSVVDCGPGVPDESLPRLFDAFYRPDEARSRETGGVGLGLAIVKSCVEACGGMVAARNLEEGGFVVEIWFRAV